MSRVTIYTDGACKGNPGPGGWGAILLLGEHRKDICGGEKFTTNNRMELQAAIEGLKALKRPVSVCIVTDSQYVMNGVEKWMPSWIKRNWKTQGGADVKNKDLWLTLKELVDYHSVSWRWVKGHAGDEYNEQVDTLASDTALTFKN